MATGTSTEQESWSRKAERIRSQVWAAYGPDVSEAWMTAGGEVVAAFWWDLACRRRGIVPPQLIPRRPRSARKVLAGRQMRSLRNPFEPLLAMYQLGYGCGGITDHDIVLIVPEIECGTM